MDEDMIANWNDVVDKRDIVYHLGDFAFLQNPNDLAKIVDKLNGEIFLVPGNHDHSMTRKYFAKTGHLLQPIHDMQWKKSKSVRNDIPRHPGITLCHYAMRVWNKSHYGTYHLYGHSHDALEEDPKVLSMDIGVDSWGFFPVSLERVIETFEHKKYLIKSTHRIRGMNKFITFKVFDCQDMPKETKEALNDFCQQDNDTYVDWNIGKHHNEQDMEEQKLSATKVDKWLLENGADEEENVLISYWW